MVICVTNRTLCKDNFLKRVESICQAGPKFIILREKDLDRKEYNWPRSVLPYAKHTEYNWYFTRTYSLPLTLV